MINGAQLLSADNQFPPPSLSLFNSVDRSLVDPSRNVSLIQYLDQNHSQFARWLRLAGDDLIPRPETTVFAPSDEAFRALPWPLTERLYSNHSLLRSLISNHFLPGFQYSAGLAGKTFQTKSGFRIHVVANSQSNSNSWLYVNGLPLQETDFFLKDALLHQLSHVLLSPEIIRDCDCMDKADLSTLSPSFASGRRANPSFAANPNGSFFSDDLATVDNGNRRSRVLVAKIDSPTWNSNGPSTSQEQPNYSSRATVRQPLYPQTQPEVDTHLPFSSVTRNSGRITEHFKRHFSNLTNLAYEPLTAFRRKENDGRQALRPMVFYDRNETSNQYLTSSSNQPPPNPVAYHANHNSATYLTGQSGRNAKQLQDANEYLLPNGTYGNRSYHDLHPTMFLQPPILPLYDPFLPFVNYSNNVVHRAPNTPQAPQVSSYTHTTSHYAKPTGYQPTLAQPALIPPPIPPPQFSFNNGNPNYPILQVPNIPDPMHPVHGLKFLNDLTTPVSVYFDPTRRPKSVRDQQTWARKIPNNPNQSLRPVEPLQPLQSSRKSSATSDKQQYQRLHQLRLNPMQAQLALYPSGTKTPQIVSVGSSTRSRITSSDRPSDREPATQSNLNVRDVLQNPRLMLDGQPAHFTIFEQMLTRFGLQGLTTGNGQVTLFLPNDAAFLRLNRWQRDLLGISSRRSHPLSLVRVKRQQYDHQTSIRQSAAAKQLVLNHISPVVVRPPSVGTTDITIEAFSNFTLRLTRQGSVSSIKFILNEKRRRSS